MRLSVAHFNHTLRGDESDGDEEFVRNLCQQWNIPFYVGRGDVKAYSRKNGLSLESAARELRYGFLQDTAAIIGAQWIATAHNANDNAETLLLRLARGTALRGLGGIPIRRDNIIRPLLAVPRRDIIAYLQSRQLPHRVDSTNALDYAARNRIRHYAMPVMESVNSNYLSAMGNCADDLRRDEDYLQAQAKEAYENCLRGNSLSIPALLALHPALQGRVLGLFLPGNLPRTLREDILRLCSSSGNGELSRGTLHLQKSYDLLSPASPPAPPLPDVPLTAGTSLCWGDYRLRVDFFPKSLEIQDSFNTFFFASGKICGTLFLTPRREGDVIRLSHRQGTRKLRRLFIDAKIPAHQRNAIPVLRDEQGVLAVYGFGKDIRAIPQKGEAIYKVTFENILEDASND